MIGWFFVACLDLDRKLSLVRNILRSDRPQLPPVSLLVPGVETVTYTSRLTGISRVARVEEGQCVIGMKKLAMIPLIAFDLLVNVSFVLSATGVY